MTWSNVAAIFLLCLTLCFCAFLGYNLKRNYTSPAPQYHYVTEPTSNQSVEPNRTEWRLDRDLIAQTDMAKWAKYILWITACGVLLSALGIWLIKNTLVATQKATTIADEGTAVAREALIKQSEIFQMSLQPILIVENIKIIPKYSAMERNGQLQSVVQYHIEITVKNYGNTPALKNYYLADYNTFKDQIIINSGSVRAMVTDIIEPQKKGVIFGMTPFIMTSDISHWTNTIAIEGELHFRDIFRNSTTSLTVRKIPISFISLTNLYGPSMLSFAVGQHDQFNYTSPQDNAENT